MNTLTLRPAHRPAKQIGHGATRTGRHYADLLVDGVAIGSGIRRARDLISRLGWGPLESREEASTALLLERDADFPNNRRAVFVCPECGGLGCGAVSAHIERQGERVVWQDFQYESTIDPPTVPDWLERLGPFSFAWSEYEAVLRTSAAVVPPDPEPPPKPWWRRRIL